MKKILLVLAASAFVMSCNNLADNEFEITGTIDPSLNGKKVILETQSPMGFTPVDTVKVENGKFIFKGTLTKTEPEFRFITVEGYDPQHKINFILEHGSINIETNKDSLYKSKATGTLNNDLLIKYVEQGKALQKESENFQKKNQAAYEAAQQKNDQAAMMSISEQYKKISEKKLTQDIDFIKANPKGYINLFLISQIGRAKGPAEAKKLYDGLDPELKKTEKGKELGMMFSQAPIPTAPATPAASAEAPGKSNAEPGTTAPAFSANTPAGKKLSLKEAMGKVTIIDFWASWCPPCRKENPNVVALYKEYHAKGLNIIGVSLDKPGDAAKWQQAITADNLTWYHVSNLMHWDEPIAKLYGVESIPATFVLDASGKIVAKDLRGPALKAKVAELLAK